MENQKNRNKRALKTVLILSTITVLYTVYRYQGSVNFFFFRFSYNFLLMDPQSLSVYYHRVMAFILLGVFPILIIKFGFKEKMKDYGLGISRPLIALFVTLLGIVIATPFAYFGAKNLQIASIYPMVRNAGESLELFLISSLFYFLYYVGYEICFRGFLFLGIKEDVGYWQSLAISLIVTVLLHVTQPQGEMVLSILAGIVFPIIVNRLKSLWPVIFIHAYIGISLDYWIIINSGGF